MVKNVCDHRRSAVIDTDEEWDREGVKVIGYRELVDCPDCNTTEWTVTLK